MRVLLNWVQPPQLGLRFSGLREEPGDSTVSVTGADAGNGSPNGSSVPSQVYAHQLRRPISSLAPLNLLHEDPSSGHHATVSVNGGDRFERVTPTSSAGRNGVTPPAEMSEAVVDFYKANSTDVLTFITGYFGDIDAASRIPLDDKAATYRPRLDQTAPLEAIPGYKERTELPNVRARIDAVLKIMARFSPDALYDRDDIELNGVAKTKHLAQRLESVARAGQLQDIPKEQMGEIAHFYLIERNLKGKHDVSIVKDAREGLPQQTHLDYKKHRDVGRKPTYYVKGTYRFDEPLLIQFPDEPKPTKVSEFAFEDLYVFATDHTQPFQIDYRQSWTELNDMLTKQGGNIVNQAA